MTLVNNVNSDMSSLVRKELVKALQWFVLVFEHAFWNVANQECNNAGPQMDVTRTPTGMGRVASRLIIVDVSATTATVLCLCVFF